MNFLLRLLLAIVLVFNLLEPEHLYAQDSEPEKVRVELFVTASTDRAAFVGKGSLSGLGIGDRVTFFPASGPLIDGVVRVVTTNHARIELLIDTSPLEIGTRGEAWVEEIEPEPEIDEEAPQVAQEDRAQDAAKVIPERDVNPWRSPPEDWDANMPLLSSPASSSLETREASIRGRVWLRSLWNQTQLDGKRESSYLRTGTSWTMTNPFSKGGELQFDGEVYGRYTDTPNSSSQHQEQLRLSQFSYRLGGDRGSSRTWLMGRFYSQAMPEFGSLDGIEFTQSLDEENSVGASVGHMPRINGEFDAEQDYQAAVFHRHRSTSSLPLDWRVGYQRTWHEGERDRDLFVLDSNLRSANHNFVSASAWVDYYESSETAKDGSIELSNLFLAAGRSTPEGKGARVHYSEFRFPLVLRQGFDPEEERPIFGDHNMRAGLDLWTVQESGTRWRGRLDHWSDNQQESSEGYSGDVRCDLPKVLPMASDLGITVFVSQGQFSDNSGLRLSTVGFDRGNQWNLSWELLLIKEHTVESPTPSQVQNQLYASYDTRIFEDFTLAIDAATGWGDQGESLSLGFFLQRSF